MLRAAVKVALDPPTGIRAALRHAYTTVVAEHLPEDPSPDADPTGPDAVHRRLCFALAFLHATARERARCRPVGWRRQYGFGEDDLVAGLQSLRYLASSATPVPWRAVAYLLGEVVYGGAVPDRWDRRTLRALLAATVCPETLQPGFRFAGRPGYRLPHDLTMAGTLQFIDGLPSPDRPEVFGLSLDAAHHHRDTREAAALLDALRTLERGPRGRARDDTAAPDPAALPAIGALLAALPPPLPPPPPADPALDPIDAAVAAEAVAYGALRATIEQSLGDLQTALQESCALSEAMGCLLGAVLTDRVPSAWEESAHRSGTSLGAWLRSLGHRAAFLSQWLEAGAPPTVWLAEFDSPRGFLAAALRSHARRTGAPLEALAFACRVIVEPWESIAEAPAEGVYIRGLFLDGALWSAERQSLVDATGVPVSPAPLLHFLPEVNHIVALHHYECPLYRTRGGAHGDDSHDKDPIAVVELPSAHPAPFWVRRAAALLCHHPDG